MDWRNPEISFTNFVGILPAKVRILHNNSGILHQLEVTMMISHQPVTRKVLSVSILIFPDDPSPYPNPLGPHHIPHETVDLNNV